jgi:hypothetical protein
MNWNGRLVICAKDIQLITGKCERTARRIIATIKTLHNKHKARYVSLKEFCDYSGLDAEEVLKVIS